MRADIYLASFGFAASRTKAAALIASGCVTLNGKQLTRPSEEIDENKDCKIDIFECPETRYVSRGGLKLEAALDTFGISPAGLDCLDIGASTGGFTDVLLRRGAAFVAAVDAGRGQLDPRLMQDPRVLPLDKTNARNLKADTIGRLCDLAVMDVSFISQTLILPVIPSLLKPGGVLISLVKPQFEVGRQYIGRGGIVKSERARKEAIDRVTSFAHSAGFFERGRMESPIAGGDGNREFLLYLATSKG